MIEALDHVDVWTRVLPEWEPVRSRPQRNAYHRFTVDRHLLETVANAARLADRVERSDLLLVGALLHDLGKGYPGDHTDAGVELVLQLGPRLGFPADDVAVLISLVRNHLLLPDVATRRDLDDPATIDWRGVRGGQRRHARAARRPHRGRLAGHRAVGVERLEGRAGRRAGAPRPARDGGRLHARGGAHRLPHDRAAGRARAPGSPTW